MLFAHDTEMALASAAALVNTGRGDTDIVKPYTQETLVAKVRSLLAECDFAQIQREQSRARSRRCSGKNEGELEDTGQRRPPLSDVTPNSSGDRPRTL